MFLRSVTLAKSGGKFGADAQEGTEATACVEIEQFDAGALINSNSTLLCLPSLLREDLALVALCGWR